MGDLARRCPFFKTCVFPTTTRAVINLKLRNKNGTLEGVLAFLLQFLDSRHWIFKKYTWNLESYTEKSADCRPTARDRPVDAVACASRCHETWCKSPLSARPVPGAGELASQSLSR